MRAERIIRAAASVAAFTTGGNHMKSFANMTDKEMMKLLRLRFRRIGLNSFRVFIYEPDGKLNRMYDEILDAETCQQISNISLDELRALPIEKPEDVEPKIVLSMRGLLLFTLLQNNAETPKIGPAKRMLAERLVMRGFKDDELAAVGSGFIGRSVIDRVDAYLNSLQPDGAKVNEFIDLAYSRHWLDDAAIQSWWNAVAGAAQHNR